MWKFRLVVNDRGEWNQNLSRAKCRKEPLNLFAIKKSFSSYLFLCSCPLPHLLHRSYPPHTPVILKKLTGVLCHPGIGLYWMFFMCWVIVSGIPWSLLHSHSFIQSNLNSIFWCRTNLFFYRPKFFDYRVKRESEFLVCTPMGGRQPMKRTSP